MGTVRKQSIYSFIFILLGFVIGAINTLLLYAKFLSTEEYGLTGLLRDIYTLFGMLATFGTATTIHKFYPLYQARLGRAKNDLPFLVLAVGMIGCILVVIGFFVFKDLIILKYGKTSPLFIQYYPLIIPLTISMVLMLQFESLAYMLKRTASTNLVKELGFRIMQTISIVLYIYDYISIDTFFKLFSLMYVPSIIIMIIILSRKQGIRLHFHISTLTKKIYRKVISFSLFHFSGAIIAILPFALNGILITGISERGLHDTAIYTIATFMISMLDVPLRGMRGMGVATYSEAFLHQDMGKVARMQKTASLSLIIVGFCLFGLIYPNIENIVYFSKGPDFHPIVNIFLIAGSAKLIELSMGMNDSILNLSKYWRTDFFISTFIVVLSVPVNIMLIRWNPLLGAATGQAIMLLLFCLLRAVMIWWYFRIQPYTVKTLVVLLIGVIATFTSWYLPTLSNVFIDIMMRGSVFLLLFAVPILYFNVSKEMNDLYLLTKQRLLKR